MVLRDDETYEKLMIAQKELIENSHYCDQTGLGVPRMFSGHPEIVNDELCGQYCEEFHTMYRCKEHTDEIIPYRDACRELTREYSDNTDRLNGVYDLLLEEKMEWYKRETRKEWEESNNV